MGRNKIKIERITNERTRIATFNKRKNGLVKKAMELAILCGCEVALIIIGNNRLTQYSSSDMDKLLLRYADGHFEEPASEPLTNANYVDMFGKKSKKEPEKKRAKLSAPSSPERNPVGGHNTSSGLDNPPSVRMAGSPVGNTNRDSDSGSKFRSIASTAVSVLSSNFMTNANSANVNTSSTSRLSDGAISGSPNVTASAVQLPLTQPLSTGNSVVTGANVNSNGYAYSGRPNAIHFNRNNSNANGSTSGNNGTMATSASSSASALSSALSSSSLFSSANMMANNGQMAPQNVYKGLYASNNCMDSNCLGNHHNNVNHSNTISTNSSMMMPSSPVQEHSRGLGSPYKASPPPNTGHSDHMVQQMHGSQNGGSIDMTSLGANSVNGNGNLSMIYPLSSHQQQLQQLFSAKLNKKNLSLEIPPTSNNNCFSPIISASSSPAAASAPSPQSNNAGSPRQMNYSPPFHMASNIHFGPEVDQSSGRHHISHAHGHPHGHNGMMGHHISQQQHGHHSVPVSVPLHSGHVSPHQSQQLLPPPSSFLSPHESFSLHDGSPSAGFPWANNGWSSSSPKTPVGHHMPFLQRDLDSPLSTPNLFPSLGMMPRHSSGDKRKYLDTKN